MFYESVHIVAEQLPMIEGVTFKSFSNGWYTLVDRLENVDLYEFSRKLSKMIDAPIFCFSISDEEMINITVFKKGKIAARYDDYEFFENRKIYDIPALAGLSDGMKRRLSVILGCVKLSWRISLLEEYFGVCILSKDNFGGNCKKYKREKSDIEYKKYCEYEKIITGKKAPFVLKLIKTYNGKLFDKHFGEYARTLKPHYFYYDNSDEKADYVSGLLQVRFTGTELTNAQDEDYSINSNYISYEQDSRFDIQYRGEGNHRTVAFSSDCPEAFRGRIFSLLEGYYPYDFLPGGELLLFNRGHIAVMNAEGDLLARQSISGDIADIIDDYILTASSDSFYGYEYNKKAKIHIYKIVKTNS